MRHDSLWGLGTVAAIIAWSMLPDAARDQAGAELLPETVPQATNPAADLRAYFLPDQVAIVPRQETPAWGLAIGAVSVGRGADLTMSSVAVPGVATSSRRRSSALGRQQRGDPGLGLTDEVLTLPHTMRPNPTSWREVLQP